VTPILKFFQKPATYTVVVCMTACLYLYLFVLLLLFPAKFLADIGVAGHESAFFLARRASMLMLGFAVLSFQATKVRCLTTRQVVAASIAVNMAGFAVLSCTEYGRGFANAGILPPAVIESLLTVSCILLWFGVRKSRQQEEMRKTPGELAKA
jgi:hypothetical protein